MSRYADIEPVINKLKYSMSVGDCRGNVWLDMVLTDLEKLPVADVVPVKHGHWTDAGSGQECSVCEEIQYGYDSDRHYCPNCGAKMDESTTGQVKMERR